MITVTAGFSGAGGASCGMTQVPGVEITTALDSWELALSVHAANHPGARHIGGDIRDADPARLPATVLAQFSPPCTDHTAAKGVPRRVIDGEVTLFGGPERDEAAEASRDAMWEVARFAAVHRYEAFWVENVVEVVRWRPFRRWITTIRDMGYEHRIVSLNAAHAHAAGAPAPQFRDRVYIVFWRAGRPAPDLDRLVRPPAWCPSCGQVIRAVQSWHRPGTVAGKYRAQYAYRCPSRSCRGRVVEPAWVPAWTALDLSCPGQVIGEREKPLHPRTRARIVTGIARYWCGPLIVPVEGRAGPSASPVAVPGRTQTCRAQDGLAIPAGTGDDVLLTSFFSQQGQASPGAVPARTFTGQWRTGLVTRHHGHVSADLTTPAWEPLRTVTGAASASVLFPPGPYVPPPAQATDAVAAAERVVDACGFRMVQPGEAAAGMGFPAGYEWAGSKRDRVRLAGNAVCPPVARDITSVLVGWLS